MSEGSSQTLNLESKLQELPLYQCQIDLNSLGTDLAQLFEKHARLPGTFLTEQGKVVGMISRQRFLESLIRPHGLELFLQQPLAILYSYIQREPLVLSGTTAILMAARQALQRSPDLLGEPIVVHGEDHTYQLLDIHTLNIAYWQIRGIETQVRYERTQAQMIQSDKMSSLGRLVDGVAHEILDPVSFIWGNLSHVSLYSDQLIGLLMLYEAHLPEVPEPIAEAQADIELNFLRDDLPRAIASMRSGAERLRKLASSLQNFCHIDDVYPKPADLHECIDGILRLLKSRLTSEIQVIKNYGHLPPVPCYLGQLSQVFMNILSNALDVLLNESVRQTLALELGNPESTLRPEGDSKPRIEITTQVCSLESASPDQLGSRWVVIRFANNGPALSAEAQQKVLESFSVERRVEKETSLAVSYQIITARHGGKLKVRSPWLLTAEDDSGIGTEFEILLPLV